VFTGDEKGRWGRGPSAVLALLGLWAVQLHARGKDRFGTPSSVVGKEEGCGLYSYISGVETLVWEWKNCHRPQPGATQISR